MAGAHDDRPAHDQSQRRRPSGSVGERALRRRAIRAMTNAATPAAEAASAASGRRRRGSSLRGRPAAPRRGRRLPPPRSPRRGRARDALRLGQSRECRPGARMARMSTSGRRRAAAAARASCRSRSPAPPVRACDRRRPRACRCTSRVSCGSDADHDDLVGEGPGRDTAVEHVDARTSAGWSPAARGSRSTSCARSARPRARRDAVGRSSTLLSAERRAGHVGGWRRRTSARSRPPAGTSAAAAAGRKSSTLVVGAPIVAVHIVGQTGDSRSSRPSPLSVAGGTKSSGRRFPRLAVALVSATV